MKAPLYYKVCFRVDGGNAYSLGMGHVYRCLKIADYFKEKNMKSVFIMKDIKGGVRKVEEKGYPVIKLPLDINMKEEISRLEDLCAGRILITDIRGINNKYFTRLNEACKKSVYFDDLGGHDYCPHILINPAVVPGLHRFRRRCVSTQYLVGERYFVLGPGFERKRNVRKAVKTAVVSLGGADPADYTPSLLRILECVKYDFEITLILGPAFEAVQKIRDICRNLGKRVKIARNVSNMGELMHDADIAFVAGGDTALELAYTGTPGFIVPTISYELKTAAYLEGKRIFASLGDIKKRKKAETVAKIEAVWDDVSYRRELSRNAKRLIDGRGLSRIMYALGVR